jgi:hypothetical protein
MYSYINLKQRELMYKDIAYKDGTIIYKVEFYSKNCSS